MTASISLGRGHSTTVDAADLGWLSEYNWTSIGNAAKGVYACVIVPLRGKKSAVLMHRLIAGAKPGQIVDHANGDRLDNRRANLRICTHAENMRNSRGKRDGLKGVTPRARKFLAGICVAGRTIRLGSFATAAEAALAYDAAALRHFGEFARLNFNPDRDWIHLHQQVGTWPLAGAANRLRNR